MGGKKETRTRVCSESASATVPSGSTKQVESTQAALLSQYK